MTSPKCVHTEKLPNDVKSLLILFCNLEEIQSLLKFWQQAENFTLPQWKEILNIHDKSFSNLVELGYEPHYDTEVQTRLLNQPIRGAQTITNFNQNDFAITVHLKINDLELQRCTRLKDIGVSIDLSALNLKCTTYDITSVVWINHLPTGRKARLDQNRFAVFRTGFEITCKCTNGIHCEINLLNHTLEMNNFMFFSLDVLFYTKNNYLDNMNEIIHLFRFI